MILLSALLACSGREAPSSGEEPVKPAPASEDVSHYFAYGGEAAPCGGQRVGVAHLRGYTLFFGGSEASASGEPSVRAIRSDATVPGILWKIDPAGAGAGCLASWVAEAPYEATPIWVEHGEESQLPALTRALSPAAPAAEPSAARAEALLTGWLSEGLSPWALLDALPAALSRGWQGPGRRAIAQHLSTATVTFTLAPPDGAVATGLRSLSLHRDAPRQEPDAVGADGRPLSLALPIAPAPLRDTLAVLGAYGAFGEGHHFVEPRSLPLPSDASANADAGLPTATQPPPPPAGPHVVVDLIVHDEHWYHRVRAHWPWSADTHGRLQRIAAGLGEAAATQALHELAAPLAAPLPSP